MSSVRRSPFRKPVFLVAAALVDHGHLHLMESLDLEELARERVYEFAFIALPLKTQPRYGLHGRSVAAI